MARTKRSLSAGADNTQHISLGVLSLCFPMPQVQSIIDECGVASRRIRELPAAVMVFYVVALSLFPASGYEGVLRWLLAGLQWLDGGQFRLSGKGALSAARKRLGGAAMERIHGHFAKPLGEPKLTGSYWKGLHLVAIDGSTLALQDTPSNDTRFGRSSNQNGPAAYPIARFVVLAEVGTHIVFEAKLGRYKDAEVVLAQDVIVRLKPGMLCLADRLFPGYELWKQAKATGAHLVWRAKGGQHLERIQELPDGSWLGRWLPSRPKKKTGSKNESVKAPQKQEPEIVRVVEYHLVKEKSDKIPVKSETYRLLTTILDPAKASAEEIAKLYPQRWEIELTIKESKAPLRQGQVTLRSKVADMVEQEFWGLLLAHYVVRKMMAQAALDSGRDPDQLSYQGAAEIIKAAQTGPGLGFPP